MECAVHLTTITHLVIAKREHKSDRRGNPLHAIDAFEEYKALSDSQHIPQGLRSSR